MYAGATVEHTMTKVPFAAAVSQTKAGPLLDFRPYAQIYGEECFAHVTCPIQSYAKEGR